MGNCVSEEQYFRFNVFYRQVNGLLLCFPVLINKLNRHKVRGKRLRLFIETILNKKCILKQYIATNRFGETVVDVFSGIYFSDSIGNEYSRIELNDFRFVIINDRDKVFHCEDKLPVIIVEDALVNE